MDTLSAVAALPRIAHSDIRNNDIVRFVIERNTGNLTISSTLLITIRNGVPHYSNGSTEYIPLPVHKSVAYLLVERSECEEE